MPPKPDSTLMRFKKHTFYKLNDAPMLITNWLLKSVAVLSNLAIGIDVSV